MALPQFQTNLLELAQMQNTWATSLNPLLLNPLLKGVILPNVVLAAGDNVINTRLSRKLQGWVVVDIDAAVQIYRSAPKNDLTLTLNSSGPATVSILVY